MNTTAQWSRASGRTACEVRLEHGAFTVDVDAAAGGGEDPTPHDILDAALAACTVLTLQLYAQRKGMGLQSAEVSVAHAQDGDVYRMRRVLSVHGALSEADRASLLRVAQACPVHKTLRGEIAIDTALAVAD